MQLSTQGADPDDISRRIKTISLWCEETCERQWHPRDVALFQSIATAFYSGRLEYFDYADKLLANLIKKYTSTNPQNGPGKL